MTSAIFESVSAPRPDRLQLASPATAADTGVSPDVTGFYDEATGSIQYVVADPVTRRCAVIDPVLSRLLHEHCNRRGRPDHVVSCGLDATLRRVSQRGLYVAGRPLTNFESVLGGGELVLHDHPAAPVKRDGDLVSRRAHK
jgi:hypothetical protein